VGLEDDGRLFWHRARASVGATVAAVAGTEASKTMHSRAHGDEHAGGRAVVDGTAAADLKFERQRPMDVP
jgi:hypothetical protein